MSGPDEFDTIANLLRPLAEGAPEALDLMDDAAVIPSRPGYDLVVTKDAMTAGVHFLPDDPLDLVARKLLRVNLSDLAAKGAAPYGYFLSIAWPGTVDWQGREAFARGLAQDQAAYGLKLFGGDTTSTPGPLTMSATLLGWTAAGQMVRRSGAQPGDLLQVSGVVGDGWLGLAAATGRLQGASAQDIQALAEHYRLPRPRLDLDLTEATACADVSDGLVADASNIGAASGLKVEIDLDRIPLSSATQRWLAGKADQIAALVQLATGGDDYELVATAPQPLAGFTTIGRVEEGAGCLVRHERQILRLDRTGWRHGNVG